MTATFSPAPMPHGMSSPCKGGAVTPRPVCVSRGAEFFIEGVHRAKEVNPELARALLDYDPETGLMHWRERGREWFRSDHIWRGWNTRWAGKEAFNCVNPDGYRHGTLCGVKLRANRVAFAHFYGKNPVGFVDHINRDPMDNRACNLRDTTIAQSNMNRFSSGEVPFLGVTRDRKKFRAHVAVGRKRLWSATFDTAEGAAIARDKAAIIHHGAFASLNFPELFHGAA